MPVIQKIKKKKKEKTTVGFWGFSGGSDGKESAYNSGDREFSPWVRKIPWRRKWLPTPVFFPGEFHVQRSLAGYSIQGHREPDITE